MPGRSDQLGNGNDMDTYADDLAVVMEVLDLRNAIMVGDPTGGGEVAAITTAADASLKSWLLPKQSARQVRIYE